MATKRKASDKPYKFINWKKVSDETGINQDKLYNNVKGEYHSLSPADCEKISGTVTANLSEVFRYLGYEISVKKMA